ncbi:NAD(P)H dehydrogenase (quinone) [Rhodococcus sp. 27YEA15]|uniref:NmrA family NAD(P)-binding protein n=1 Tax=Rhodococcus sp. 27YEA15 TaxID=3156259 RepID=UPI003C7A0A05
MTYTVHGATGAQGSPVLAGLVTIGADVRAITRDPSHTFGGATTVVADNASVDALTAAYRDSDGVFFHLPLAGDAETYAENVLAAAQSARPARFVVSTSGTAISDATSPLAGPNTPVLAGLVDGLRAAGIDTTVLSPRLFLENLLAPDVTAGIENDGVLRYPLRTDLAVAWSSHLDVAAVAVAALTAEQAPEAVQIGQIPALTGPDLAEAFAQHLSRPVTFESQSPEEFRVAMAPIIGERAAAEVAALYTALGTADAVSYDPAAGSAALLGVDARSTRTWLADLAVN